MRGRLFTKPAVILAAMAGMAFWTYQVVGAQQVLPTETSEHMLTYSRGEPVLPAYHGWYPNEDGTIDLWFGYLNQNWREELDVPVGPDNMISGPYGPDSGQPTHFLPRNNRFIFKVTVQEDFPEEEVVWTLTTYGQTHRAYATLHPGYVKDAAGIQREYFGQSPAEGNDPPEIQIEGALTRDVVVGQPELLTVIATDDGVPGGRDNNDDNSNRPVRRQQDEEASICGDNTELFFCGEPSEGGGNLSSVKGLRMQCFLYRGDPEVAGIGDFGDAAHLTFDPPQAKAWEDHRNGTPWAAGYQLPPIPPDNTWNINTTFSQPGTYVVRCQAHDGLLVTNQDITFNVSSM